MYAYWTLSSPNVRAVELHCISVCQQEQQERGLRAVRVRTLEPFKVAQNKAQRLPMLMWQQQVIKGMGIIRIPRAARQEHVTVMPLMIYIKLLCLLFLLDLGSLLPSSFNK